MVLKKRYAARSRNNSQFFSLALIGSSSAQAANPGAGSMRIASPGTKILKFPAWRKAWNGRAMHFESCA
jgi:hypothetical protein